MLTTYSVFNISCIDFDSIVQTDLIINSSVNMQKPISIDKTKIPRRKPVNSWLAFVPAYSSRWKNFNFSECRFASYCDNFTGLSISYSNTKSRRWIYSTNSICFRVIRVKETWSADSWTWAISIMIVKRFISYLIPSFHMLKGVLVHQNQVFGILP